ncbi:hypothetical protein MTO96_018298 [Rhipicephalus appendiculatus]
MRFKMFLAFFVAAVPLLSVTAQGPSQDEIKSLPGLSVKPTFKQYSGFLNAGPNRRLHYWFAASQTPKASLDPVVIWVANVLFLDAPAGSGYSYDATGSYATDDEHAADDTYLAILDFYHKFSLYGTNDVYIVGQGQAATHVTLVVERLLEEPTVKLMGYAINNGILDDRFRRNGLMFFAYYHGLFGRRLWSKLTTNCCNGAVTRSSCNFVDSATVTCQEAVKEAGNILGTQGLNMYNIYAKCEPSKNDSDCEFESGACILMSRRTRKVLAHHLGVPDKTLVTYGQWLFDQQIGGYVEYYAGKIAYLTIKGAGHRVSRDKPPVSLQVFQRFITNAPF